MNSTTITIELTFEERLDMLRFRSRLLAESRDRMEIKDGNIFKGTVFTDSSREAERIIPILDRILKTP